MGEPLTWGTCATCGDATPPGALTCPTCGKADPTRTRSSATGTPQLRRRLALHKWLRVIVVVGIAGGLTVVMVQAAFTGPPQVADPLSGTWSYSVAPGQYAVLSGQIVGEDYIIGNYTVVSPPGALAVFSVFNSSEFTAFAEHRASSSAQPPLNESASRIVFNAPYSDTYYFVWQNPYAPSTGIHETLYASTQYQSNVAVQ
ncbi:MAG: hypothetical protein L3K13_05620 [Thermoplasmata archaeon]|nr:hypothetical protein [Thermoplasmata archaeon]